MGHITVSLRRKIHVDLVGEVTATYCNKYIESERRKSQ